MVSSSVGLVSSFFSTIQVSMMRISNCLIPAAHGFWQYFCFQYHSGLDTMQEPSHLGTISLVSIRLKVVLTQIITQVFKDSLTLRYPPNTNIWLVLQFCYPRVGPLILLLKFIIETHTFTYIPVQHWCLPMLASYTCCCRLSTQFKP